MSEQNKQKLTITECPFRKKRSHIKMQKTFVKNVQKISAFFQT